MGFIDKKMTKYLQNQHAQVLKDVKQGGRSVEAAKAVLRKWPAVREDSFWQCSVKELKIWREAMGSKKSFSQLTPAIDRLILEKQKASEQTRSEAKTKAKAENRFKAFSDLSARELIAEAEELSEDEVRLLLAWEKENKNRAMVVKSLNEILSSSNTSPHPAPATSPGEFGPNPFQKENEKIYKKGRGTVRERCQSCGEINAIDVSLLSQVVHRRSNSTRGRMEAWADRQIEGGARMTGNHTAAEMSRANQMHIANLVSSGLPCVACGAPMIR